MTILHSHYAEVSNIMKEGCSSLKLIENGSIHSKFDIEKD